MNIRDLLDMIGGIPDHTEVVIEATESDGDGGLNNILVRTISAELHNVSHHGNEFVIRSKETMVVLTGEGL